MINGKVFLYVWAVHTASWRTESKSGVCYPTGEKHEWRVAAHSALEALNAINNREGHEIIGIERGDPIDVVVPLEMVVDTPKEDG